MMLVGLSQLRTFCDSVGSEMGIHTCGCPVGGWEQHPALLKDHGFVREASGLPLDQQEPPDPGTQKVLGTGSTPQVHAGNHGRGQVNSQLI